MANKEMYFFKNEIYNICREMEIKLFATLNKKNSEIITNLTIFNDKVNSILESNKLTIDSITNQKINFEQIQHLTTDQKIMSESILSHNIKINNIISDIDKLKYRYDRMVSENIIIPGYVGPGCDFKNLGDYIINSIKELKILKEERNKFKKEDKELKTKVELMMRNMNTMLEYNSSKIKEFESTKDNEIESLLENKMKKYNEKSFEENNNLINTQNKMIEKIQEIRDKLEQFNKEKIDINSFYNKFEEINKREEEMKEKIFYALEEIEKVQKIKKELNDIIKNINKNINSDLDIINNHSQNKEIKQQQKKLNTDIINNNINLIHNKSEDKSSNKLNNNKSIRKFEAMTKNNKIPNLNNLTNSLNKKKTEIRAFLSVHHDSKKELNTNQNLLSDKKVDLKKNNFIYTAKNLKKKIIMKTFNKEVEKVDEPPLFNSLNSLKNNNNNLINSGNKIREKIIKKALSNFRDAKKELIKGNKNKKLFPSLGMLNLIKEKKPKLKLNSLGSTKIKSEKILSMSDTEEIRRSRTFHNCRVKKKIKNNSDEFSNIKIMARKKTFTRNINIVDCNLVNLNLLEIPNINDENNQNNNSNSSSQIDLLRKPLVKKRKIRSVDTKRTIEIEKKFEKNNIVFDLYKLKK